MRLNSITVADLIELLQEQDPDALVVFTSDYGDICHTAQALPLKGDAEEGLAVESAYSNSGFGLAEDDEDQDDDAAVKVLVLR
jgi:hypothetical protein